MAVVYARDVDAFMALFDDDGASSTRGAHAFVTFTGLSADGRMLRSLNNRLT
jgi:hypothetical protein